MSEANMALQQLAQATARLAARHPGAIVVVTLLLTVGFVAALVTIPAVPSSDSFEGSGEAVKAEDRIEENLPPTGFAVPFIVGADTDRGDNVLTRATFNEILALEAGLRRDPVLEPYVFEYRHPHLQIEVSSIWSLPDTLRAVMDGETPLSYAVGWHEAAGGPGTSYARATDQEFQGALDRLLTFEPQPGETPFRRAVSDDGERVGGVWTARSLFVVPTFDYQLVFEDYTRDPGAADREVRLIDDFQLYVQDRVRDQAYETQWVGIGLGINEEVEREIAASGRLVALSFVLIGVFLYLTLRNMRDFITAYLSLPLVIIWMLGGARILGLSVNQFTAMLPVLILALAVDYAIHGVRRYREERAAHPPRTAITRSISLLGPALLLAAGTTATAFLSNAFSSVEALRDWGIEGGVAILAALWIAGVYTPALRHLWDRWRVSRGKLGDEARASVTARRIHEGTMLGRMAAWSGRHPWPVLVVLALVTIPSIVAATQITSDFDADDFLDKDSELIQGVRRVAEDYPDEGEPAILLVEGDVADPEVLAAIDDGIERFAALGYRPERDFSLVRVVKVAMEYPDENDATDKEDADADGIPDQATDLRALLAHLLEDGVWARVPVPEPPPPEIVPGVPLPEQLQPQFPDSQRVLVYSAQTVRELVHPDDDGGYDMTVVYFGIPGTDNFNVIPKARADWMQAASELYAMEGDKVDRLTLTGEPYKRLEMVDAITDSLQISITVSIVVVFLIVLAVFRDLLYAIVTVIPVLVLVAWLFAFMVLIGLSLNLVTVTVAAMAIGVGIDYSIHITERYREEIRNKRKPLEALRRAMDSSGVALLGSALTTIAGFLVLMLAPMPLFATFGLITAAMAAASFLAAATILPPFLVLVERWYDRPPKQKAKRRTTVAPA